MSNQISVDLTMLSNASITLNRVKNKIDALDKDLEVLYWKTGKTDFRNLNFNVGCKQIKKVSNSTQKVSSDFSNLERSVRYGGLLLDGLNSLKYCGASHTMRLLYTTAEITTYIGKGIQKDIQRIKSSVESILVDYYSKGFTYKLVQYGKVAIKAAKGVSKIVAGVGSIIGTGGLSTPIAILTVVSGANDVYNSIVDGAYVNTEQYDEVGKHNVLKDRMVEGGEMLGELVGNKQLGNIVANVSYYGIDIVTSLASLDNKHCFDKLKQIKHTDKTGLISEIKDIGKLKISDIRFDDYTKKLMSYSYPEINNLISNAKLFKETVSSYIDVGKAVNGMYEKLTPGFENPVTKILDKFDSIKDNIGKATQISTECAKFIFD